MKQFKNFFLAGLFALTAVILSATVFAGNTAETNAESFYSVTDSTGGDTTNGSGGGIINPGNGH